MWLIHNKEFPTKFKCKFTLNKKYVFQHEIGHEYAVCDDNGEVWIVSKNIIFEHFTFGSLKNIK